MPILYHIGKKPAQPKPGRHCQGWTRGNRQVNCGVFLTSNPVVVCFNHGLSGNVYAYRVPGRVIRAMGGMKRFDSATEIIIDSEHWSQVEFLGKSMDRKTLEDKVLGLMPSQARQTERIRRNIAKFKGSDIKKRERYFLSGCED